MLRLPRPKRFMLWGVPVTYELALRLVLLAFTLGALIAASIPKVRSIIQQANVVSVTMTDSSNIPAPGTLICGELMDTVDVQMVSRGIVYPNGTVGPELVRPVPPNLYNIVNATSLNLRANGDWPTLGKCVLLQPQGLYFANNGTDENALDTIVFVVQSKDNFNTTNDIGLSIAMWDGNVPMQDQQPIWTGIPSINTLTFIYSEHILLHAATPQTHYTLQKQNLRSMQAAFFANQKVIGRVILSPDTFYVTKYLDKPSYTWVDLAGAIGGMASIALAVWIFLFGSGKYKSWGVMQRYVLGTSPNSRRYRDVQEPGPKNPYDMAKHFFKKQISRLDSSADHELDHVPLQGSTLQDRRRLSARYSTAMNLNTATTVAAAVAGGAAGGAGGGLVGSGKGARSSANAYHGGNDVEHLPSNRLSLESHGQSNYYFSDQGAPGSQSLQPLAPISEDEDDTEEQVSELIRLIDLRVDERMWSLERTLARYYLDGFRLRNYSAQYYNGGGAGAEKYYLSKEDGFGEDSRGEGVTSTSADFGGDRHSRMELLQGGQREQQPGGVGSYPTYATSPTSPSAPSYPPRPQITQQYQYIDEPRSANAAVVPGASSPRKEDISGIETAVSTSSSPPPMSQSSSFASQHSNTSNSSNTLLVPGFPQRRDMRGTIRRAVERLQNEWPQSHGHQQQQQPEAYVPRTQYQSRNYQSGSGGGAAAGYSSANLDPSSAQFRNDNPPGY